MSTGKAHGTHAGRDASAQADPLVKWQADHHNFARLLGLLERQVDAFRAEKEPDYALMHAIVHYLRHYPDRTHHPREDVAFARLAERDPAMQMPVARRIQEHAVIAAAGDELLGCLEQVLVGAVIERAKVEAALATYLVYYRHHVIAEESEVIPRALAFLTPADWAAVAAVPIAPDPLFGQDFDARYHELRRHVQRMAQDPG